MRISNRCYAVTGLAYAPNLDAGKLSDWQLWLESIRQIEALNPAVVLTGHGPVSRRDEIPVMIDEVRRVLKESIARGVSPTASWLGMGH